MKTSAAAATRPKTDACIFIEALLPQLHVVRCQDYFLNIAAIEAVRRPDGKTALWSSTSTYASGAGKTEMALAIKRAMGIKLIRLDPFAQVDKAPLAWIVLVHARSSTAGKLNSENYQR
jgi:hypothetical protein